jgi:hypothetical protein
MNTTATIIVVFLACCVVSLFYWHVIRETLIIGMRLRLFARRDRLRRLAIDGKEDHSSFAYREVEGFICKTIAIVPSISLASFILFMFRNPNLKWEAEDRFHEEASSELEKLQSSTVKDALYTMMMNSPILVAVAAFVILLLWVAGRFKKMLVYRQVEQFVEELPNETEPLPQVA